MQLQWEMQVKLSVGAWGKRSGTVDPWQRAQGLDTGTAGVHESQTFIFSDYKDIKAQVSLYRISPQRAAQAAILSFSYCSNLIVLRTVASEILPWETWGQARKETWSVWVWGVCVQRGFSSSSGGASMEVAPGWLNREVSLTLVLVIKAEMMQMSHSS